MIQDLRGRLRGRIRAPINNAPNIARMFKVGLPFPHPCWVKSDQGFACFVAMSFDIKDRIEETARRNWQQFGTPCAFPDGLNYNAL